MTQTREASDRYSNITNLKLKEYLEDNPIESYIDIDEEIGEDATEFELMELGEDVILEVDANKAYRIGKQIINECYAQKSSVKVWLTKKIMKQWKCRTRMVRLCDMVRIRDNQDENWDIIEMTTI